MSNIKDAMRFLGFKRDSISRYSLHICATKNIIIKSKIVGKHIYSEYWVNGEYIRNFHSIESCLCPDKYIKSVESKLNLLDYDMFAEHILTSSRSRQAVMAAINTKNLASDLVRVRSSNIWAYKLNIKNPKDRFGDLIVQFKSPTGGSGDVYIYYDIPVMVYRRWQSAPSKGHYFWLYIRNNYRYSKLTGDKHGKLKNAIN